MKYTQLGFFDAENKYERLTELGDPLEKLNDVINWEMFREKLTAVCQKENYTKGGRPPIDVIIKFKASILRRLYNLSFDQIEYQINDRLTFMRFLGLGISETAVTRIRRSRTAKFRKNGRNPKTHPNPRKRIQMQGGRKRGKRCISVTKTM
jgi:hypothetical protein